MSWAVSRSSGCERAVSITIRMPSLPWSSRSARQTSTPDRPGIVQSRNTRSGRSRVATSSAVSPSGASKMSKRPLSSVSRTSLRMLAWSSAMRTLAMASAGRADEVAHLGAVEVAERVRAVGVELGAGAGEDLVDRVVERAAEPVRAVARDGVDRVGDGEDARPQRDLVRPEAGRVAAAVPALVVVEHDVERAVEERDRVEDPGARLGVAAHEGPLAVVERPRLLEHGVGDRELPDVVQQESVGELRVVGLVGRNSAREQQADLVDTLDVRAGVAVLGLDRGGEGADGVEVGELELAGAAQLAG